MSGESYEGWANRATWLAHLWTSNDEASYYGCMDLARGHMDDPERVGRGVVAMIEAGIAIDGNMHMDFHETVETVEYDEDYEEVYDIETRSILPDIDVRELGEAWIATTEDYDHWEAKKQ